jgi:chorismate lyase / 3-hydroxybenzoate synthase
MNFGDAVYHPRPPILPKTRQSNHVRVIETPLAAAIAPLPPLRVSYVQDEPATLLAEADVLAVIGFGSAMGGPDSPRFLRVGLEPILAQRLEVWRCTQPVSGGYRGDLRWSSDGNYLFFAIEVDEAQAGDIDTAAEQAYTSVCDLVAEHRFANGLPGHVVRLWNYMDSINEGEDDNERYRRFCSGRARGLCASARNGYSAATAIGRRDGKRVLQVYGLASREAGVAVENPRQISAWSYPRQYGPVAPTFARATHTAADQLLVSGTAAVVGHQSLHAGDTFAQIDETLVNLDSLLAAAGPCIASRGIDAILLKVYLRDATEAEAVEQRLRERLPGLVGLIILISDICRSDLRIEIDGIQG